MIGAVPDMLVQLTDLHVRIGEGEAEATDRIRRAVDIVLDMDVRPAAVLLTGDLVNVGAPDEYQLLAELVAPLVEAGLDLLPLVGNHDDRSLLRASFEHVEEIASLGGARHVQYVANRGNWRIVALDTQRAGSDAGKICDTRFAWLEAALAADRDTPTVIAMHHPPGAVALPAFDEIGLTPEHRDRLRALVGAAPNVERIVHGHVHRTITATCSHAAVFGCPSIALPARPDFTPGVAIELVAGPIGLAQHVRAPGGELVTHARMYPAE